MKCCSRACFLQCVPRVSGQCPLHVAEHQPPASGLVGTAGSPRPLCCSEAGQLPGGPAALPQPHQPRVQQRLRLLGQEAVLSQRLWPGLQRPRQRYGSWGPEAGPSLCQPQLRDFLPVQQVEQETSPAARPLPPELGKRLGQEEPSEYSRGTGDPRFSS